MKKPRESNTPKKPGKSSKQKGKGKEKGKRPEKPAWMLKPPQGADKTKSVNGKSYNWCSKHKSWGEHPESECRGVGLKPKQGNQPPPKSEEDKPTMRLSQALTSIMEDQE